MARSWKSLNRLFASAILGVFASMAMSAGFMVATTLATPALAQSGSPTLSTPVAKVVIEALELIQNGDAATGISKLNQLLAQRGERMSAYEKATVYELLGGAKATLDPPDYAGALREYERAIGLGALPEDRDRKIRFNMAQLYAAEEQFDKVVDLMEEYIRYLEANGEVVDANTWYLLAAAYYQLERYTTSRRPMEKAIAQLDKPRKSYYELLNAIYVQLGEAMIGRRSDLLVKMINYWPDNSAYWGQLAQVYQVQRRDREAAAVLETAYRAGLIKDKNQIRTLIQYYNFLDTPYRGAVLLEKELARGTFQRDKQTLELLGQLWSQAREHKKAIVVLTELAEIDNTGKSYFHLGQSLVADGKFPQAVTALRKALNKGLNRKQSGEAWLLIGSALYSINSDDREQRNKAKRAYQRALDYPNARATAQGWISYINSLNRIEDDIKRQEEELRRKAREEEIDRCEAMIDRHNLGGLVAPERLAECQAFIAEVNAGNGTEAGAEEEAPAEEETPAEEEAEPEATEAAEAG